MFQIISAWFHRYFSDPEAVVLVLMLSVGILLMFMVGNILMPALLSLVIAYLLQGIVLRLERFGMSHTLSVLATFALFIGLLIWFVLWLVPLLWQQAIHLISQLPKMVTQGQVLLGNLVVAYPNYFSQDQLQTLLVDFETGLAKMGQFILSLSLATIPTLVMLVIYLIVVPFMVYFFLMDKTQLLNWVKKYLPKKRSVIRQLWNEVNRQIGNYIRGRVIEIILVSIACYILFASLHLSYAMLLSALVGFSVIIPYVGATIVTIPVVMIGFFQWGWNAQFAYLIIGYTLLITLDAYILVPLLFSEVVNLHPVAIILSILFFGGLWGFWGVFFAIPLAIVIKAALEIWPKHPLENLHETSSS